MEFNALRLCVLVFYFQAVVFTSGLTLRRLSEKIDVLEYRLNFENAQRHKDYEYIISKLSEITTKLDKWEDNQSFTETRVDTMGENIKVERDTKSDSYANMNDPLQYLINGMKEEKRLNAIIRRKLPRIERDFNAKNDRTKRELSRLDSEIVMINLTSKEHFEKFSQTIVGLVNSNNEQFENINNGLDLMVTTHHFENLSHAIEGLVRSNENLSHSLDLMGKANDDKYEILRNEIDDSIKKRCNLESIKHFAESSMERLPSNISLSFEETSSKPPSIASCKDAYSKGYKTNSVYTINYDNNVNEIKVYCDQATDGGGWTVFQRRVDGEVDFFQDWASYKMGFGDLTGEFWLGNDYLSAMLGRGKHELRIDMGDFKGNRAYAKYSSFRVESETSKYTLRVNGFSGDAGDSFEYHNGQNFSTKDSDNSGCSELYKGGWWYNTCHRSNLNGLYHSSSRDSNQDGVIWRDWKGRYYSLKFVEMKFRLI